MNLNPLSSIIDGISTFVSNRQKLKQAKVDGEISVIKAESDMKVSISKSKMKMAEDGQFQDYNLDRIAMEDMKNSWFDELLLISFLLPIFKEYYSHGFAGFNNIPSWYFGLVIGMVVVKYGMRGMLKDFMAGKYKGVIPNIPTSTMNYTLPTKLQSVSKEIIHTTLTAIQRSYGITETTNIPHICKEVCAALGNGINNCADTFIYRIAKAETGAGTIIDRTPKSAGAGPFQHDKRPFYDNQSRYEDQHVKKCISHLGINPKTMKWEDLLMDIEKGAIATRLHFKPIEDEIPKDIVGQAQYWKRWYNTSAGAGSVKHFLEMNDFDMSLYREDMEVEF